MAIQAPGTQMVHYRGRRRTARGFAAIANRNAATANQLYAENLQLKQQLSGAMGALWGSQMHGACRGSPPNHVFRGFSNRFLGRRAGLMSRAGLGGLAGFPWSSPGAIARGSRFLGQSRAYTHGFADGRANAFATIAHAHAGFLR